MATNAAGSTVIELATHPLWCSSQRYSRELAAAKRRHPSSYRLDEEADALDLESQRPSHSGLRTNSLVTPLSCARVLTLNAARGDVIGD
ncbi:MULTISPECIES: hypothetical protein [Mycolicibacterium]|uniref:Uncharacterized protein n=1 Tax=Mycolicibacterium fortuitum TaxID=1766 RepID=A0ABD6QCL1_MYCFO|nr:hypothetical protein [Mycolicibacterium fortuitum]NOP97456.1 hypothetical protein [Mycolicibacterium fortuitum]OBA91697.1 hypothetical protein A5665_13310 [Mycolicibacterium fortuitum]OBI54332.1 hypothetical protein A5667_25710 [Mycolicibacterium fortuitum]OBI70420.1 hypothetical protein A5666_23220 [Mycolicibacterium fortuitum]OMC32970.1 hypothetical protein A5742_14845 [Mycolicibacterium fortuitum]